MNVRHAALDELWHPAAATALERALHPAGHGPNSSSLLRPQAAVVAVAYSAEKLFIIEQCRAVCRPPGIAFSRVGSQRKTAVAALVSCGNSRAAVSVLALSVIAARCQIPPFVAYATSSPGAGEVFPQRESLWQNWKVCRTAKASPFGRGGCDQREQTERASPLAGEKGHTPFMTEL